MPAAVISSYYMQVLSLGLVWTAFHCSGMCGPLIAGLTARSSDEGSRARRLWLRARRVLAYQAGRAVTYAAMGAGAGIAGVMLEGALRDVTAAAGFVLAPVFALLGARKLAGRGGGSRGFGAGAAARVTGALRLFRRYPALRRDLPSSFLTGAAMGFLPCMIMFWVLGIAATTSSVAHGAGVMVLLVLITTPTLLLAGCAASFTRVASSERLVGAALIFSGVWMLLVALAANGLIDHAHLTFRAFGQPYMLMFF